MSEDTATVINALQKSCERNMIDPFKFKSTWNTVLFDFQSMKKHPSDSTKCVAYFNDVFMCRDVLPLSNRPNKPLPNAKQALAKCLAHEKTICRSCREALDVTIVPTIVPLRFHVEIGWEYKNIEVGIQEHLWYEDIMYKDDSGILKEIGKRCNKMLEEM